MKRNSRRFVLLSVIAATDLSSENQSRFWGDLGEHDVSGGNSFVHRQTQNIIGKERGGEG
jgi:hypothetical protein